MVVRYPRWTQQGLQAGSIVKSFTTCMDLAPTFLDLAGVAHPNPHPTGPRDRAAFRGRQVYGMRGKSLQPFVDSGTLSSSAGADPAYVVHGDDDPAIGWELFGRAALRRGKWKIVHMSASEHGKGKWELFDLDADQGETVDLAEEKPDLLNEMLALWAKYVEETGTVWDPDWSISTGTFAPVDKERIGGDPTDDQVRQRETESLCCIDTPDVSCD